MRMNKNNTSWEKVFELGNFTIRVSRSQFAIYEGYREVINWQW